MDPNNTATNNPNTNPPANEHVHITPPTINSNTSTSPSSESTPTSQSAVAATPQSAAHPRSIFMPLIIAIIVYYLLV